MPYPIRIVDACLREGRGGSPTAVVEEPAAGGDADLRPLTDAERGEVPLRCGTSRGLHHSPALPRTLGGPPLLHICRGATRVRARNRCGAGVSRPSGRGEGARVRAAGLRAHIPRTRDARRARHARGVRSGACRAPGTHTNRGRSRHGRTRCTRRTAGPGGVRGGGRPGEDAGPGSHTFGGCRAFTRRGAATRGLRPVRPAGLLCVLGAQLAQPARRRRGGPADSRQITRPFGVNLLLDFPMDEQFAVDEGVTIVSTTGAGGPADETGAENAWATSFSRSIARRLHYP